MSITSSSSSARNRSAWQALANIASNEIERLLEHLFSSTDSLLYDLSKRAATNSESALYFDSMRILRADRETITVAMLESISHQTSRLSKSALEPQQPPQDLSLLSGDELDRILACENVINKIHNLYYQDLSSLAQRLTQICSLNTIPRQQIPFSPVWLAHCFAKAIPEYPSKITILLFKQLEKHLLRQLEPLLSQCNEHLIKEGYTDGSLANSAYSLPKLSDIRTSLDDFDAPTPAQPSAFALPLHSLRQVLASARFRSANDPFLGYKFAFNPGPVVPLPILSSALTQQQLQIADQPTVALRNNLSDYIGRALNSSNQREPNAINPYHEDIIQLVAAFFDELLDDEQLSSATQALVCRLQIPVLKVALRNEAFFSQSRHPARRFINLLTNLSQALDGEGHPEQDPLYAKLLNAVKRINKLFDLNEDVFTNELESLEVLDYQEKQRSEVIEQRTLQAEEGRARFDRAKKAAKLSIDNSLVGQEISAGVNHFAREYWQQVMVLTYLKEGEGKLWQIHKEILDDIVWLCHGEAAGEATKTAQNHENIRQRIILGLDLLHLDVEQTRKIATKTMHCALETQERKIFTSHEQLMNDTNNVTAFAASQRYMNLAKRAKIDCWVRFMEDSQEHICRLASKTTPDAYIFVNRMGMKKYALTQDQFAMRLQKRLAVILEQEPMFDRLMNKALSNLKEA